MGVSAEWVAEVEAAEVAPPDVPAPDATEVAATDGADGWADRLPPVRTATVVREELPAMPEVIVEGILYETHKLLLTGPSKAHKTWTLLYLAEAVSVGGWWLGMRCAKRKVLFVDLETDPRSLEKRISDVAYAQSLDPLSVRANLDFWPLRGQNTDLDEVTAALLGRYRKGTYGVIFIDPTYMVQDGDENSAKDIKEFFAKLDYLAVNTGATIVISHHHSKGAQGLKASIDRGSGSGVFGRAPDAVVDLTELVLEAGTLELARQSNKLAATKALTGWRLTFTLREFAPKDDLDAWYVHPLLIQDDTGLLADCKPNYGGLSESRRARQEAEGQGKVAQLDACCEKIFTKGGKEREFIFRSEVEAALVWSTNTVNRWLEQSARFRRESTAGGGKTKIVRREADGDE